MHLLVPQNKGDEMNKVQCIFCDELFDNNKEFHKHLAVKHSVLSANELPEKQDKKEAMK